jgi:Family of unknown function (DUF6152)
MKIESTGAALLASILLAAPATILLAQQTEQQRLNEAMQMQRGIYSQDAAANLDEAIGIFREIAGPRTSDRALAAEAQYRLSQALLQKGDLTGASEAMVVLSTNFPDQAERISRIAGGAAVAGQRFVVAGPQPGGGPNAGASPLTLDLNGATPEQRREMERAMFELLLAQRESLGTIYDRDFVAGAARTLTTTVENLSWTNPQSWLRIADGATHWNLLLPAPNRLIRLGMTRESLPVGEQVTVVLTMDASGTPLTDGSMLGRVESIVRAADGVTVFDRAQLDEPTPQF